MDLLPALGLVGLLFVKEAGVPVPVPGDLLVIGAGIGAAAAGGGPGALALLAAILVAGYAGGSLQFALVRGAFRAPLLGLLRRAGISEARLERLAGWLRRRGGAGVAAARATPGIRVGVIAASGLAALPFGPFLGGLVVGNGVFVGAHFVLGLVVGPPALAAVSAGSGPAVVVVGLAVLALLGGLGWIVLRRRRRARPTSSLGTRSLEGPSVQAPPVARQAIGGEVGRINMDLGVNMEPGVNIEAASPMGLIDGLGAWADAACPACLAVELIRGG